MSLKKYNKCDETHAADFEYVCLKEKRVFCVKCWYRNEHFKYCYSSRCGQYDKIAHLVLNRSLQYKNSKLLESMCQSHPSYEALRVRFLQLNFQVTEILKEFVEQKMPLLFWGTINELLREEYGSEVPQGYNKFDSYCTQMIKIVKSGDSSKKQDYLQSAIGAYYDINHQLEGELKYSSVNQWKKATHMEDKVTFVIDKIKDELGETLKNIKKGFRNIMDSELQKTTNRISKSVKYKGIAVQKVTPQNECFRKRQEYPYLNLISQEYSKIANDEKDIHLGFTLNLAELENNPEQLLHLGKCFLKQKLFEVYDEITTMKSVFPYRYTYLISTTLSEDRLYEQLMIDLERTAIDSSKLSSFDKSRNLIIIGREVIVIRFHNSPKFSYHRKIYNYKKERSEYYNTLMVKLDLERVEAWNGFPHENIEFSQELTELELAYCNFRIAYENVFLFQGESLIFEGQKVSADRGAQQFPLLLEHWKKYAQIDLDFCRPRSEMIKCIV